MPEPDIHPTAIIDPLARIAPGVKIGPWCHITGDVTLGEGCILHERVTLHGPLILGARNVLYPQAAIGLEPQYRKFDPATAGAGVLIGDDNILREGVTIHRATGAHPTTLGHRNYLMVNSHLGHDVHVGNDCTFANGALIAGHAIIHDSVTFGGNAAVHQFCHIGRLVMVGGVAATSQDVPPFCTVYNTRSIRSLNIIGLRRGGYRAHIDNLQEAFDLFFLGNMSNMSALEKIEKRVGLDPLCREFIDFIRTTLSRDRKRGISPYDGSRESLADDGE